MGKLTISMAIFKSYVSLPEGNVKHPWKFRGGYPVSESPHGPHHWDHGIWYHDRACSL